MVFSSIPAYLDPANWQQQPNHHHHHHHHHLLSGSSSNNNNNNNINVNNNSSQLHHPLPPPPPPPPGSNPGGGGSGPGGAGSIRPGSMADRARMANIPLPEPALKCPRCESTNTKFCYFNNYSLTQPRHFCKTCRRYWTRGGALRNVPVGGGCRRNKRSSSKGGSSRSKSPASSSDRPTGSVSSSGHQAIPSNSSTGVTVDMIAAGLSPQIPPPRFMNPFADHHFAPSENLGLNYGMSYGGGDLGFQIGSGLGGGGGITSTPTGSLFEQQWRFQQQTPSFPFMSGSLDPSPGGLFDTNGVELSGNYNNQVRPPRLLSSGSTVGVSSQMAPVVKTEDPHHQNHQQQQQQQQEMNLSRQLLGIQGGNNDSQYWMNCGGNGTSTTAWTDLSGFSSTSTNTTNHPL